MILGDAAPHASTGPSLTLDGIFRSHAQRRPYAIALVDPVNRASFTGGRPRRLSYAEADRIIGAMAARLRDMGLPTDAIVGIQLPNTVENFLATLAVLRAGMIVAALPLLCRRADAVTALTRVGAKAIITCDRVGVFDHAALAMTIAAEVFSIRYVCGFGEDLPDGIVSFSDLLKSESVELMPLQPDGDRGVAAAHVGAAHVATITFDVGEDGMVPVARSHAELLAGGLAVLLESGIAQDAVIQSTTNPSSFSGMSLTLVPWLLCGGTLELHHPFDATTLAAQMRETHSAALILPGPVASRLAAAGFFDQAPVAAVVAAWRAPDRLAAGPIWRVPHVALVDVAVFSETALVPARRLADGRPSPIPLGPLLIPRGATGGTQVAEISRTKTGTVAVRGAMVPRYSFPPGIEASGLPHFKIGERGLIDTGYPCRLDSGGHGVDVTGAPAGVLGIGGYRFARRDLHDTVGRIDPAATLLPHPHALIGRRLAGGCADRAGMRAALDDAGINPLIARAFADHAA
jgi:hypothetical protein